MSGPPPRQFPPGSPPRGPPPNTPPPARPPGKALHINHTNYTSI